MPKLIGAPIALGVIDRWHKFDELNDVVTTDAGYSLIFRTVFECYTTSYDTLRGHYEYRTYASVVTKTVLDPSGNVVAPDVIIYERTSDEPVPSPLISAVALSDGRVIATWQNDNVEGAMFASDGSQIGDQLSLSTGIERHLFALNDGGFYLIFLQSTFPCPEMGQRFDAAGNRVGDPVELSEAKLLGGVSCWQLSNGDLLVLGQPNVGEFGDLVPGAPEFLRVSLAGEVSPTAVLGGRWVYFPETGGEARADGTVVVFGVEGTGTDFASRLYSLRQIVLDQNGQVVKIGEPIFSDRNDFYGDSLQLPDGRFMVTWHPYDDKLGWVNYGQILLANGTLDGDPFLISNGDQPASLALLPDGRVLASWGDSCQYIHVGLPTDSFDGAGGDDTFVAGADRSIIAFGGDGHDQLMGGIDDDILVGNADIFAQEADTLSGGGGDDTIYGEFTDTIDGGDGHDLLYATNDYAWHIDLGATHIEWMSAGWGNDIIDASSQIAGVEDYASGGDDMLTGSAFDDSLWGGVGNDVIVGGDGNDILVGGEWADSLSGGDGNDMIHADSTDLSIDGGAGWDALYMDDNANAVVDLGASHIEWISAGAGNDIIDALTQAVAVAVCGNDGADVITGSVFGDFLWGGAGNDVIYGGAGDDVIVAGDGANRLIGGAGHDTIYLDGWWVADVVVLEVGGGTDLVFNFYNEYYPLGDHLDVTSLHTSFDALTIIEVGGQQQIAFQGELLAIVAAGDFGLTNTLTAADFQF
ncbi:MAG: calcium-binding protein [Hyphomicrobiaceae bacterium]